MELFTAQQIQSLNELELLVYRYINEHPNTVPFMRIRELAAEARPTFPPPRCCTSAKRWAATATSSSNGSSKSRRAPTRRLICPTP